MALKSATVGFNRCATFLPSAREPTDETALILKTLGGRLSLILLTVVVATQAATLLVLWQANRHWHERWHNEANMESLTAVLPAVLAAQAASPALVAQTFNSPIRVYQIHEEPGLHPSDRVSPEAGEKVEIWLSARGIDVPRVRIASRTAEIPARPRGIAKDRPPVIDFGHHPPELIVPREGGSEPAHLVEVGGPTSDALGADVVDELAEPAGSVFSPSWAGPSPLFERMDKDEVRVASINIATIELPSGEWLSAYHLVPRRPRQVEHLVMAFSLVVGLIAATVGFVIGRRLLRPVRALERAAERLGRGESVEPIPVEGPAEVANIITAFNRMADRLDRATAYQASLLQGLGHDLRSPLVAIGHLASRCGPEAVQRAIRERLTAADEMVESITRFAQAALREAAVEEINLAGLIEVVIDEQVADDETVDVDVPQNLYIPGRMNALKRAFANLIDNALQYGVSPSIAVRRSGRTVEITVADRGSGMSAEQIDRAFEPFVRYSTDVRGSGLGLAIAKTIVVDHGGDIELRRRAGGGIEAVVTLPLSNDRRGPAHASSASDDVDGSRAGEKV